MRRRLLYDQVSVVMITHNRGSQIRVALQHLLKLPEKPHIIVVDNNSSDETVKIARDSGVEVIQLERNLGGAGRNIGVARAETPYVAFSDDDSWWRPGALRRAVDLFDSHPHLGLVAAKMLVGPDEQLDSLCQTMALGSREHHEAASVGIPIVGFAACGAIVRREAFLESGGFDQRFGVGGEEEVLALDLLHKGWQLAYVDGVVAHHYPSPVRDPETRKRRQVRNALWSAWLRRPGVTACAATWRVITSSLRDKAQRAGLVEAMLGLPWVLSARNPISAEVDRRVRMAEATFHTSSLSDFQ